jgi:hypothetical protein
MAQTSKSANGTLTDCILRSFYYYYIKALKKNSDGKLVEEEDQQECFYKAFENINALFINKKFEKLTIGITNGDRIHVIPDEVKRGNYIQFRLVLVRTNALPLVEQGGELAALTDYISDEFGLAEITHCVIFPEFGIMGTEYNNSGARATAMKEYLPKVVQDIEYLYCVPHLNQDVFKQLVDEKGLTLFQLEVRNTPFMKQYIAESQSVFRLLFSGFPESDTYEVTLKRRPGKNKKGFTSPMSTDDMKDLIRNCDEDINKFKISQGSIQKDAIDLLGQKVVYKTEVIRTANKHVDSLDAYRILTDYFNEKVKGTL